MSKTSKEIRLLTDLLTESFQAKAWHGPNLNGSIRGLSARKASWRPGPRRHNIWEVAIHCAYWKYIVWRRITGERRGSFYLKGSNWFRSGSGEKEWERDKAMLKLYHERLLSVVRKIKPAALGRKPRGSTVSNAAILRGIASHDVYHAGQIQLLKRLSR